MKGLRLRGTKVYLLWALIAAELLMSFSFFGYLHIEPISITIAYIPVLLAGCLLGPWEAALVGAVFGTASMWKASAFYISAGDALFSPVMSGKPLQSIFHDIWNWDTLLFALVQGLLVLFCCWCLNTDQAKRYSERIRMADQVQMGVTHNKKTIAAAIVTIFIASFSVAWYFTNRIESVMSQYGIYLSDEISYDITHLQIQFLLGIISLFALAILAIILHFKNVNYLYYEAKLDGLTGLASRDQFFRLGENLLKKMKTENSADQKRGYFAILDIDCFKEINDRYGHPEGDRVLKAVSGNLKQILGNGGLPGRLGGDEFVALIHQPVTADEIKNFLNRLKDEIGKIRTGDETVTCSIGVVSIKEEDSIDRLYHNADQLLYAAKKNGKNQFVFDL